MAKIEIRDTCKVCDKQIVAKRSRTYCSVKCRRKFYNEKYAVRQQEWARKKRGEFSEGKLQCHICGKWYVQVLSHAHLTHGISNREYKEKFGLDRIKGYVPSWYHEEKSKITKENGSGEHLPEVGRKTRFKKGQKGLGSYRRSEQTMERLKSLHKNR